MRLFILSALIIASSLGQTPVVVPGTSRAFDPPRFDLLGGRASITLADLLEVYSHATGKRFIYNNQRTLKNTSLKAAGEVTFLRQEADRVLQGILVQNGFALQPIGGPQTGLFFVQRVDSSRTLKTLARPVALSEIASAAKFPALVVMTVVPLRHVPARQVRQALSSLIQNRVIEQVQTVERGNAVLLTGLGPTVAGWVRLIAMLDQPSLAPNPTKSHTPRPRRSP